MGVVVPDKPQKNKILNHGWYDHVHVTEVEEAMLRIEFITANPFIY